MKPYRTPSCVHGDRVTKDDPRPMLTLKTMRDPAPQPCLECPMRRDSKRGFLGGYDVGMFLEMLHGPAMIACHCSPGFQEGDIERQHQCAGMAMYRANVEHQGGGPAVQAGIKKVGKNTRDVFASPNEFYFHHRKL